MVGGATSPASFRSLPAAYAAAADSFLSSLLAGATCDDPSGIALLAVGGYGRGELAPGSDLDVVLLHKGRKGVETVAENVWYAIWDEGIKLDHSVRTVREAITLARSDLRVVLGMLDARVVAGDPLVAAKLIGDSGEPRALLRAHARRYLPELAASVDDRHRTSGEVPFLLEPDLKESLGGLRDVHALRAAALALPALAGSIGPEELDEPAAFLLQVRVALHVVTGRPSDRLLLQEQDAVAEALDFRDADRLMAAVAAAGREIARACGIGWRRVRSWCEGPRGHDRVRERALAQGVVLRDDEIALAAAEGAAETDHDPCLIGRVAALAADLDLPIAPATLDRLLSISQSVPDPWPDELRHAFLAVLGSGRSGLTVLEALDQRRILERLIPEWTAVRSLPQRNAYHRFTVDRHLLEAAAHAADLLREVSRPDLLLVAALLHDIGKGYPGDHTDAGVAVAGPIALRMGFDEGEAEVIVRLVKHHLLLADVATRRDLEDPGTIEPVARTLENRVTVELLAALTEADSLATGPAAWGNWKARLVSELAARTLAFLGEGGGGTASGTPAAPSSPAFPSAEHLQLMREGVLRLVARKENGSRLVTVVAPDRPGLLSVVAGVLTLHRLQVRSARAGGGVAGMAVERFEVEESLGRPVDWSLVEADIAAALADQLLLEARLADQGRAYTSRRPAAARSAPVKVLVDNDASSSATVVEVRAPDSHGLLHRIAKVLAEAGLDVVAARVNTLGHEAVDCFYVRRLSEESCKVTALPDVKQLERVLVAALQTADNEGCGWRVIR